MKKPVVDYREFRLSKLNDPKFSHLKLLLGWPVYFLSYFLTEHLIAEERCRVIHCALDDVIPFCEYFVVPYLLWFGYVAVTVCWLCIKDKEEGGRLVAFLIAGMTVFIVISAIFPNGLHLRPRTFARDNIFVDMVRKLYVADTSTNVVPSIHVYNSIGIMIAVCRTKLLKKHRLIKGGMLILGVSIICSTVLIKQHSMLDVLTACILSSVVYAVCYRNETVENESMSEVGAKIRF